ncbi:unnamed protein product [Spirodela intermedia]|uniref:Uncharacterized protein n=1 Tax=Spirodela intermedia TaxID=51605 RepID=A0A7I8JT41_SPIIN|nr:unnamed protein product [Spirodela intermedia]CAA6672935.1 unnamed protein product [Spirodela intermedia]
MASLQRSDEQAAVEKEEEKEMPLEEIGEYRALAQQNSIEAIRAAEERYAKARESTASALKETDSTPTPPYRSIARRVLMDDSQGSL